MMPGDIDPGYGKCAFCGVTVPAEATTDGECTDRQWCATQAGRQISESDEVATLKAQLEEARHFSQMAVDHAAGEGDRQEAAVAGLRAELAEAMKHLADAREEVEAWENIDTEDLVSVQLAVKVAVEAEREACARISEAWEGDGNHRRDIAFAIRARR